MKNLWTIIRVTTLVVTMNSWGWGQMPTEIPTLHIPVIKTKITVDGNLDEDCWKQAAHLKLSDYWEQKGYPLEPTEVRLAANQQGICMAFICVDREILATHKDRDDRTHKDDCIEAFFGVPNPYIGEAVGYEVNAIGTMHDFLYRYPGWYADGYDAEEIEWKVKQTHQLPFIDSKDKSGYIVEIFISWNELRVALPLRKTPERLRANFSRWNYGSKGRIFTIWSDPHLEKPKPHHPDFYGWLVFEKTTSLAP